MKRAFAILVVLALFAVSVPVHAETDVIGTDTQSLGSGEVIASELLPGGASITLILRAVGNNDILTLSHTDKAGITRTGDIALPHGVPNSLFFGACQDRVQVVANWMDGYDRQGAPIERYTFRLAESTGVCRGELRNIILPFVPVEWRAQ